MPPKRHPQHLRRLPSLLLNAYTLIIIALSNIMDRQHPSLYRNLHRPPLRPRLLTSPSCHWDFPDRIYLTMTSISRSYYQPFLAQGVCIGLGKGFTYIPMLAAVSQQFPITKRPIALGICSTGAVFGGTIVPIMLRQLIPRIVFGQAVRSVALVDLGCALIALAIICRRPNEAYPARRLLDLSALHETPYAFFTFALFLICLPYYVPFTYISLFAQTAPHSSQNLAGYLLAVANTGSLFNRVMPYVLDARFTPIRLFVFWTLASAALLFGWIGITAIPGSVIWCVLWGFVSGALVTAPIVAISHRVLSLSPGQLGTRMGMAWFAAAAGELIGAPIAGGLANVHTGCYTLAQAVSGAIMVLGALCLLWPVVAISRYNRQNVHLGLKGQQESRCPLSLNRQS